MEERMAEVTVTIIIMITITIATIIIRKTNQYYQLIISSARSF